jgi:hypothetical protein
MTEANRIKYRRIALLITELIFIFGDGEGLDFETRVMDGHVFELDDNSFDMASSRLGVQNHKLEVTHGNTA